MKLLTAVAFVITLVFVSALSAFAQRQTESHTGAAIIDWRAAAKRIG